MGIAAEIHRGSTERVGVMQGLEKSMFASVSCVVVHENPDDDALVCLYLLSKLASEQWDTTKVVTVPSGEKMPGSEGDPTVVHLDTGGGPFDQHGKGLKRGSSASLMGHLLGITDNPAYANLIEMSVKVDNAEAIPPTDLHFIIEGLRYRYRSGEFDLSTLIVRAFELFDMLSAQGVNHAKSEQGLKAVAQWHETPKGKVCFLSGRPNLRDAAFKEGAAVVVWTKVTGGHRNVGVQVHRDRQNDLFLWAVAEALRKAERHSRGLNGYAKDLKYPGTRPEIDPSWYYHEKGTLILNGSQSHPLTDDTVSRLGTGRIVRTVVTALGGQVITE